MTASLPPEAGERNAFGRLVGLSIDEAADGVCRAHLDARAEHRNAHGVMHGGALFALADTAMGAALHTLLTPEESCTTIEIKINFAKAVAGGRLDCVTTVLRRGRSTAVIESRLEVGGALVAVALGTYAIVPRLPDSPAAGGR